MKMKELLNEIREIQSRFADPNPSDEERLEKIKKQIVQENAEKIVELAYENTGGTFSGHVFIDPETGELHDTTWTGNTTLAPELNWIKLYSLDSNWIANNSWILNDILENEEWEELKEKYGDEADFLNRRQLESIGVNLDERLKEYLIWCIKEG